MKDIIIVRLTIVQGLLLPTLRKSLGVKDDSVRSEIMQLIGHTAHTLPALVVRDSAITIVACSVQLTLCAGFPSCLVQ
jgi:hypothetical protein